MEQKNSVSISVIKLMIALLVTSYFVNLRARNYFGNNQLAEIFNTGTPVSTLGEDMVPLVHQALVAFSPGFAIMLAWTRGFAKTEKVASSRIIF